MHHSQGYGVRCHDSCCRTVGVLGLAVLTVDIDVAVLAHDVNEMVILHNVAESLGK